MAQPTVNKLAFLFTTIEDAARLWEQHPQAMAVAHARYHAIIHALAAAHQGHVFQAIADDCCLAFPSVAAATEAAIAMQQQLTTEQCFPATGKVKMALHAGMVEQRGDDYFAPLVFGRLARILNATHGGQIIVSAAVADDLPASLARRDMGERSLRDIGAEHLYQLVVAGLPDSFPPLRTLDSRPNNLPTMPTSFVGREQEQRVILQMLRQPDVRLVTLTGPGGTGKTRLCLEVAADLLDEFADGVFFVPLAAISDPKLVATSIAQTFNLRETGTLNIANVLANYLADKQILLVLDNFEQIVAAAPLLDELLAAAPQLKLLVSSRERLHLVAEHEYDVPTLPLAAIDKLPPLAELIRYPAFALFVQRAEAAKFDFRLDEHDAATIAAICARLDGLPLAIELAAARACEFTLEQILASLDDRFALLQREYRDRSPRQRSLRGAIDWSYNLLSEGERLLFTRLSVFVSGGTLAAISTVCNTDGDLPFSIAEGMNLLVDKSLVQLVSAGEGDERYQMLETIREYASQQLHDRARYSMTQKSLREYAGEQLASSGEGEVIHERHARFYLALGEQAGPLLRGAEQATWLNRLAQEHDNLRSAVKWGLTNDRPLAVSLIVAIWRFWLIRGYLSEGRQWLNLALEGGPAGIEPLDWANALNAAGGLARMQGDFEVARQLLEQALQLHRTIGNKAATANATYSLANVLRAQHEIEKARALYEETAQICTEVDDMPTLIAAYGNLGELALAAGDLATARPILQANLARAHKLGEPQIISQATDDMARVSYEEGDYRGAEHYLAEGTTIQRRIGFIWGLGHALSLWAKIKTLLDEDEAARTMLKEVVSLGWQVGDKSNLAYALNELAIIAVRRDTANVLPSVKLFAASATLLASINAQIEPIQQPVYDQALAQCHQRLSEDEFAQTWAEGEATPLAQIVDYAINQA